jgi:hypothetical protein
MYCYILVGEMRESDDNTGNEVINEVVLKLRLKIAFPPVIRRTVIKEAIWARVYLIKMNFRSILSF